MSEVRTRVEQVYREDSRRILATLIRLLGDFGLAEEALHEAFFVAVERWQRDGVPDNPRTWLVSTGRFKAIDVLRRRARFKASQPLLLAQLEELEQADWSGEEVEDDRLRGGLALFVDGDMPRTGLSTPLKPESEVYLAPAVAGG